MTTPVEHPHNDIQPTLNLAAYLQRIGYEGNLDPTLETLKELHFAHTSAIPFENLDILLGRGISLDLADLQAKLVASRRGGYCFEQNALFAAVLESLGFKLLRLAARVRFGATEIRPRTHMLLEVEVDNEPWLADVGFGCTGLRYPVLLRPGEPDRQGAWAFRVKSEGQVFVLQSQEPEGWLDLYAFTREPQFAVDYVLGNHFTATHPHSPFVQNLIVQKGSLSSRLSLRNRELTEVTALGTTVTTLAEDDLLLDLLADRFGLELPPGTRFPGQPPGLTAVVARPIAHAQE
jgi:N-hydroxyarylamine O-acetyltransferase